MSLSLWHQWRDGLVETESIISFQTSVPERTVKSWHCASWLIYRRERIQFKLLHVLVAIVTLCILGLISFFFFKGTWLLGESKFLSVGKKRSYPTAHGNFQRWDTIRKRSCVKSCQSVLKPLVYNWRSDRLLHTKYTLKMAQWVECSRFISLRRAQVFWGCFFLIKPSLVLFYKMDVVSQKTAFKKMHF